MRYDGFLVRLETARTEPHFIGIKPERRTKLRKGRRERSGNNALTLPANGDFTNAEFQP